MAEDHLPKDEEKLISDLYESWWLYWEEQRRWYADPATYEKDRSGSWDLCLKLCQDIYLGRLRLSEKGRGFEEATLVPILALTIRGHFACEEELYKECVILLIDHYPDHIAADGYIDEVDLAPEMTGTQVYYIYQPEYGYDD